MFFFGEREAREHSIIWRDVPYKLSSQIHTYHNRRYIHILVFLLKVICYND